LSIIAIDVVKQVLKSSVGLALFDDYKNANVVEKNSDKIGLKIKKR
jgi:hypothetical protein